MPLRRQETLLAGLAWLRMWIGELATPALAAQIASMLDRAVRQAPESVPVRSYRAQVLERLGRDEEALRDFRFVARRAPEQVDAVQTGWSRTGAGEPPRSAGTRLPSALAAPLRRRGLQLPTCPPPCWLGFSRPRLAAARKWPHESATGQHRANSPRARVKSE